jgi:ankyrin repeat protein
VQSLLTKSTDVNAAQPDGMTALHWASLNGDAAMVDALLKSKASLEPVTRSAATRRSTSRARAATAR